MDKKEARKILGVTKETSRNDIERKYSILLKKHKIEREQRAEEDSESGDRTVGQANGAVGAGNAVQSDGSSAAGGGSPVPGGGSPDQAAERHEEYSFDQVTQAYNILMGYEVVMKEEPPSKAAPLLKKAGIDEKKARNFFYYYKFHILAAIAVFAVLFFTIRSCVTQVRPDFNIAFVGKISYTEATDKLRTAVKAGVPEIKEPGFDGAYISDDDKSDQQYAMVMKSTVLLTAGDIEVFILDKENYLKYAKQGAFLSLDEIAPKLGADMDKNEENITATEETDTGTGKTTVTGKKHLYGIDISKSAVLKDAGVVGNEFIAAIFIRGKQIEKSEKLLQLLMK